MYPEICSTSHDWADFYSSYVKTCTERDIAEEISISNKAAFSKFLACLAARTGNLLNKANITSEIGVSGKTIDSCLGILEETDLVFSLQPYCSNHLRRALKTPKIYFKDTGLVLYLTRWTEAENLEYGAMSGAVFETFAINEIIKSYSNEGKEYNFSVFYYRGKDNDMSGKMK